MQQLFHILQLLVRHYKVYYPVRHHLVQQMINSISRLGFSPNATIEYRKLSVELAEVIIKWELQRIKEENEEAGVFDEDNTPLGELKATALGGIKRTMSVEESRKRFAAGENSPQPGTPGGGPATLPLKLNPPDQLIESTVTPCSTSCFDWRVPLMTWPHRQLVQFQPMKHWHDVVSLY